MTSPVQLIEKLDDFAVNDSISEIAFLTTGLLQLQHARYPHLVPMYRTVHRKIPRPMVFRAIRWVNPKRMFPGAGLTREEMMAMSEEELRELAVKLNDYRGEAHVIHNRYNEMLDMIEMGELPYYIPYAGFKQDKWTMLQEYKDRALRLKEGTEDWENILDNQAVVLREILNKEHDVKFDDIDGLWVDAKDSKREIAPNFFDPKKGREKKQFLRRIRNGKLVDPPKVYARKYIAVPAAEVRKGEEVRMPAGGQIRRPQNRRERKIFNEFGGAAEHLMRMPRGPFLGSDTRLRERGNLISMPAGRKNPLIVTFNEVSDDDVANRRVGRWTHTDPLGKRGRAPHRGGASRGAQGSVAQEGPEPHRAEPSDPSRLRGREERIRQGQQRVIPRGYRPPSTFADEPADVQQQAQSINAKFNNAAANLFKQYDIDTTNLDAMKAISENDIASVNKLGGGVNAAGTLKITLTDGSMFMYKIVEAEQKSEQLANILDRVLDLNTQVDAVIKSDVSIDLLKNKGVDVPNKIAQAHQRGGGHLQGWCQPNCDEWGNIDSARKASLFTDDVFRESYLRMTLLDFVGGNWDRHLMNFMVTSDGKLQGIDNGFHGGYAEVHNPGPLEDSGSTTWRTKNAYDIKPGLFATTEGRSQSRHKVMQNARQDSGIDSNQVKSEAEAVFDRHFDEDKIKAVQQELGLSNQRDGQSFDEIKNAYLSYVASIT